MSTSRFRERDNLVIAPVFDVEYTVQSTDGTISNPTVNQLNFPTIGSYQGMRDVVTPRFREQSKRGAIFNNPLYIHRIERGYTPGSFGYTKPGTPYDYTADFSEYNKAMDNQPMSLRPGPVSIDTNLQALAATAALGGVDSPVLQGLVSIAELRETIGYLRDPAESFVTLCKKARRAKVRNYRYNALTVSDYISSQWLSYRYAMRPIIADFQNGVEALVTSRNPVPDRKTSRGFASDSDSYESSYASGDYDYVIKTTKERQVRAGVLYATLGTYDAFGVNLAQLPSAGYELIPFSFVVDWFANIGTYVSAISPKYGTQQLASWTTTTETTNIHWQGTRSRIAAPRYIRYTSPLTITENVTTVHRTPGANAAIAWEGSFLGGSPATRVSDALALAFQVLRSK